jgi:hypothetical protein
MGSSSSIIFRYEDHLLEQKGDHYYWVLSKNGQELARMEVTVEKKYINLSSALENEQAGHLIYTTDDHVADWVMINNYLPNCGKPIHQERPIIRYKLTYESLWSKVFYVM